MRQGSPDDFQTPKEALYPLIPFLKKDWLIWECACGKGNLVEGLKELGFDCFGTDINQGREIDFVQWVDDCIPDKVSFDCIITNPPFSLKQEFIEKCYELKKPFALLLPLTTFETLKRQKLFRDNGIQVIFFDKRIKFETPSGRSGKSSSPWFATAWFTWGLNLPKDLMFAKLQP